MPEISDIFNKYAPAYLEKYGDKILPRHRQAIADICSCQTEYAGGHVELCPECNHLNYFYNSCCNRSCPKCQGNSIVTWLKKRKAELLPVPYYHIVATFPQQMRRIIRSNAKKLLPILMREVANILMELAADPKFLGGKISIMEILHTWSQTLIYHPHVHCLVPGGGISFDNKHWIQSRKAFFLPVKKISYELKKRLKETLANEVPEIKFPASIWKKKWVVHCKKAAHGSDKVMEYLSRYVYKVAITNNRIISDKNGKITFRYRSNNDRKWKTMPLDAFEFIRRFLQHVPPKGFHKVRFYGLLSPKNRKLNSQIKTQLELKQIPNEISDRDSDSADKTENKKQRVCPHCHSKYLVTIIKFARHPHPIYRGNAPP